MLPKQLPRRTNRAPTPSWSGVYHSASITVAAGRNWRHRLGVNNITNRSGARRSSPAFATFGEVPPQRKLFDYLGRRVSPSVHSPYQPDPGQIFGAAERISPPLFCLQSARLGDEPTVTCRLPLGGTSASTKGRCSSLPLPAALIALFCGGWLALGDDPVRGAPDVHRRRRHRRSRGRAGSPPAHRGHRPSALPDGASAAPSGLRSLRLTPMPSLRRPSEPGRPRPGGLAGARGPGWRLRRVRRSLTLLARPRSHTMSIDRGPARGRALAAGTMVLSFRRHDPERRAEEVAEQRAARLNSARRAVGADRGRALPVASRARPRLAMVNSAYVEAVEAEDAAAGGRGRDRAGRRRRGGGQPRPPRCASRASRRPAPSRPRSAASGG